MSQPPPGPSGVDIAIEKGLDLATVPRMGERLLFNAPRMDTPATNPNDEYGDPAVPAANVEVANLISSLREDRTHLVTLDIDHPCRLVETSPGKFHLFIDAPPIERDVYFRLLFALESAKVIERGWVEGALREGASVVRLHPWRKNRGTA